MWSLEEANLKIARLREMPYGTGRTAAAEFIARTIENEGPEQKLPEALLELVEAYVFGTPNPASFATFSQLLRLWDTHPEYFSEHDGRTLFWQFKWVTGDLAAWPQISRQQARGLLDEMRKRYAVAGFSAAAVDRAEYMWAGHLGLDEEAERWRAIWLAHGEDEMDCGSCKIGGTLRDHVVAGEFEQAVALGAPTEDLCNREPANSHRQLALAYLQLGDGEAAGRQLARAQATSGGHYDPDDLGMEFEILARGGQLHAALDLLAAHGQRALQLEGDPGDNRGFLRYLVAGLAWTAEEQRQLPTRLHQAGTLGELYDWAVQQSVPLARAFDERAGNRRFTESLEAAQQEPRLADLVVVTVKNTGLNLSTGTRAHGAAQPVTHQRGASSIKHDGDADPYVTADGFLAAGDLVQATYWYERAGEAREAAGQLMEAGIAFADAAQSLAQLRERGRAAKLFERAWELLLAGSAPARLLLAVLAVRGQVAELLGQYEGLEAAVLTARVQADAEHNQLEQADAEPWQVVAAAALVTHADDLLARLYAAEGKYADAAQLAGEVAKTYEQAGYSAHCSAALLLAGQCAKDAGQSTQAAKFLEGAVAAFDAAQRKESKAKALNLLIEVLNKTGQTHRVQNLLDGLL